MLERSMVGGRIRDRRVSAGLKQAELAKKAGISASYLNLIEHDKRRIGGRTLLQISRALDVEPSLLSEGAGAHLIAPLQEVAAARAPSGEGNSQDVEPELDQLEEFASRFPGWGGLLVELSQRTEALERTVKSLTERLAHNPQLAEALHEVISTATSIRSTAAILAETQELEPEWQMRFHRNINEDGARLAEGAEALMRHLEVSPDMQSDLLSPQDELHAFLDHHGYHFSQLEGWGARSRIDALVEAGDMLRTGPARGLARAVLAQYTEDARAIPLEDMRKQIARLGSNPDALAAATGQPLARVFRRLSMLPVEVAGPVGLITVDGAGAVLLRKPVLGFTIPRTGPGCTLWPVYDVLGLAGRPVRQTLHQGDLRLTALAVAEDLYPAGFDMPALRRAHMLLLPTDTDRAVGPSRDVGVTCQICPAVACAARREPSILAHGL